MSLVARYLESHGVATAVMGCARDIVERCRVPRFLFSDFPLGNSAGRPHDVPSQNESLGLALTLFDAPGPVTHTSSLHWSTDDGWKDDYLDITQLTDDQLTARRAEFDTQKSVAKDIQKGKRS